MLRRQFEMGILGHFNSKVPNRDNRIYVRLAYESPLIAASRVYNLIQPYCYKL